MKWIAVLLTFILLHFSEYGLGQSISFSGEKVKMEKVLEYVQKQSGYVFLYNKLLLKETKPVSLNVQNVPLIDFLNLLFKDQPVEYTIEKKTILLSRKQPVGEAQSVPFNAPIASGEKLHGRIVDTTGKPLAGATVLVEQKKTATFTSAEGEFSVEADPGDRVKVSFIGYASDSFKMRSRMPFQTIVLKLQSEQLTQVVVQTGYQTLNQARTTGSYGKPDMEVFNKRTGTMDIMSRLDGLVAGLTLVQGSNSFTNLDNGSGSTTRKAVIRGSGTIVLKTDPLYVVNGVPVADLSVVNPDDIADITVLKDAAAAAIWGAKSANGVIVITTKAGNRNTKMKIGYSAFYNYQGKPDFDYIKVLDSKQYIQAARETFDPVTYPWNTLSQRSIAPHEQILYDENRDLITAAEANQKLDSLAALDNRAQIKDTWFRNASAMNHTLSASGGGNLYAFYASVSYTDSKSPTPGATDRAYRLNLNQDFNPAPWIKVALNTSLTSTELHRDRYIDIAADFLPYQMFFDNKGQPLAMDYIRGLSEETRKDYAARSRISFGYNPWEERFSGYDKYSSLAVNLSGDIAIKLWKGLSFKATYGYQKAPGSGKQYEDISGYRQRREAADFTVAPDVTSTPVYYLPVTGGKLVTSQYDMRNWTARHQLIYSSAIRQGLDRVGIQVGHESQEQLSTSSSITLRGYDERLQTSALLDYNMLRNGIPNTVTSFYASLYTAPYTENEKRSRYNSWFVLGNYSIANKYFIDGSWRVDHSNLYGSDFSSQNKPAWSVGGRWLLSREDFLKGASWIDNLALRATLGITGNAPSLGTSNSRDVLHNPNTWSTPVSGTGLDVLTPANRKLNWESTRTINIGTDFSFFQSRLSGSIAYYEKKTTDLLGVVYLNPLVGMEVTLGNLGDLRNRGIEVNLQSTNTLFRDFSWTVGLVFSYNKNKLLTYQETTDYLNTANGILFASYLLGYPNAPMFGYRYVGLDEQGDPQIKLADGTVTKSREVAKAGDMHYMGTSFPVYNGGFTNSFYYKGFTLSANIIYNLGHVMRKDVNQFYVDRLTGGENSFTGNVHSDFARRWKQPGDEKMTNIPGYVADYGTQYSRRDVNYYTYADINVVSASYVKLRDITLGYSIPSSLLQRFRISTMNFYVQATNFMIWRANKEGIDPEFNSAATGTRILPPYKHGFSIGTNITL